MLGEGAATVVDEDSNYVFELPEWADEKKIKTWVITKRYLETYLNEPLYFYRGQLFFLFNMGAMARALICGFFAVGSIESIARVLIFTKQSSTPVLAYRRFRENGLHAQLWHQHPIKPGTPCDCFALGWSKFYYMFCLLVRGNPSTLFEECTWLSIVVRPKLALGLFRRRTWR